jgi:hypothetical protein
MSLSNYFINHEINLDWIRFICEIIQHNGIPDWDTLEIIKLIFDGIETNLLNKNNKIIEASIFSNMKTYAILSGNDNIFHLCLDKKIYYDISKPELIYHAIACNNSNIIDILFQLNNYNETDTLNFLLESTRIGKNCLVFFS